MKIPGVYVVEENSFPNSIVAVETAIPAFIGYTETVDNNGATLTKKPWRIGSMMEFVTYFGEECFPKFTISATALPARPALRWDITTKFLLHSSVRLFFENGGDVCYIVSVGSYQDAISKDDLSAGIDLLLNEQEPTMVVIPDAVLLPETDCIAVQQAALKHCGQTQSRVAILDLHDGWRTRQDPAGDCVANFRDHIGDTSLNYGAAYYPWLNTTFVDDSDVGYQNISNLDALKALLRAELISVAGAADIIDALAEPLNSTKYTPEELNKALRSISPAFVQIVADATNQLNLLPPSGAIAAVYTSVDRQRGVWKAPANVGLSAVISPAVAISDADQGDLNVTPAGKSINAIRLFPERGTLIWGARTLDGNSSDWRYINVRRLLIMLEQSMKLALKAYIFQPNDANTWAAIRNSIENFLTGIWRAGGLQGTTPKDAFFVSCGLGTTMTADDILNGRLNVTVGVAPVRPAEFIVIAIQQLMQTC